MPNGIPVARESQGAIIDGNATNAALVKSEVGVVIGNGYRLIVLREAHFMEICIGVHTFGLCVQKRHDPDISAKAVSGHITNVLGGVGYVHAHQALVVFDGAGGTAAIASIGITIVAGFLRFNGAVAAYACRVVVGGIGITNATAVANLGST